jgi:hypothetical protein
MEMDIGMPNQTFGWCAFLNVQECISPTYQLCISRTIH